MEELEKTCENCKYEYEDMEGTHCRHCIHNAEERFEPKVIVPTEAEIRAKAIDDFAEELKQNYRFDSICRDDVSFYEYCKKIDNIAENLK